MSNEIATQNNWMTTSDLIEQVAHVQNIMNAIMIKDEHYGVIPGCGKKPTLLKAGAEKLCFAFRIFPEFEVTEKPMPNNHREIVVKCILRNSSGCVVGQGVGSCSTMESKYRYRQGGDLKPTGNEVPKSYWDAKKNGGDFASIIGGKKYVPKKEDDGKWMIYERGDDKVENPDIADTWNTVLKMAKKRAHVDATITATASSDIFTQDIEDLNMSAANYREVVVKGGAVVVNDDLDEHGRGTVQVSDNVALLFSMLKEESTANNLNYTTLVQNMTTFLRDKKKLNKDQFINTLSDESAQSIIDHWSETMNMFYKKYPINHKG